jgi:hypothetical protein
MRMVAVAAAAAVVVAAAAAAAGAGAGAAQRRNHHQRCRCLCRSQADLVAQKFQTHLLGAGLKYSQIRWWYHHRILSQWPVVVSLLVPQKDWLFVLRGLRMMFDRRHQLFYDFVDSLATAAPNSFAVSIYSTLDTT